MGRARILVGKVHSKKGVGQLRMFRRNKADGYLDEVAQARSLDRTYEIVTEYGRVMCQELGIPLPMEAPGEEEERVV